MESRNRIEFTTVFVTKNKSKCKKGHKYTRSFDFVNTNKHNYLKNIT